MPERICYPLLSVSHVLESPVQTKNPRPCAGGYQGYGAGCGDCEGGWVRRKHVFRALFIEFGYITADKKIIAINDMNG